LQFHYLTAPAASSHFSVIVSKKISKKAVTRNTIRRRVYGALQEQWHMIGKTCYDVVVLVSPRIVTAPYQTIEKDIQFALKKLYGTASYGRMYTANTKPSPYG